MFRHHQIEPKNQWDNQIDTAPEARNQFDNPIVNPQGDAIYDFERVPPTWSGDEEDTKPCGKTDRFNR